MFSAHMHIPINIRWFRNRWWQWMCPPQMGLRYRHMRPDNQLAEWAGCYLEGLCFHRIVCQTALTLYHSERCLSHFVTGRLGVGLQAAHINMTLWCSADTEQCFSVCLRSKNIWFILFICFCWTVFDSTAFLFIHDSDSYTSLWDDYVLPQSWWCLLQPTCNPMLFFFLFYPPSVTYIIINHAAVHSFISWVCY